MEQDEQFWAAPPAGRNAGWRRRLLALAVLAVAAAGLVAPAAQAADKVVKIGMLGQITGKSSADGQESVRGAQMAIEEANAAGGIAGYKFELVVGDVKDGAAGDVTSAAERLLGDPDIQFMLTGYASLTNFEIDMMADAGMPYMLAATPTQTRGIIAPDPAKYWCCWSLSPPFEAYGTDVTVIVDKLAAEGKVKLKNHKVAIISSDNVYSKGISEDMKKKFKSDGWTITVDEMVPFGEVNDWRTIITKVRNDPPDLVINTDYLPNNSATFLKQFLEQPTDSLVFLQYAPSVPEFVKLTGAASTGVLLRPARRRDRFAEAAARAGADGAVQEEIRRGDRHLRHRAVRDALESISTHSRRSATRPTTRRSPRRSARPTSCCAMGQVQFDPKTHLTMQDDAHIPITFFQIGTASAT